MKTKKQLTDKPHLVATRIDWKQHSGRNVPSRDPAKQRMAALFKTLTGCTTVTQMVTVGGNVYRAHCFMKGKQWDGSGYYEIVMPADA